MYRKEYAERDKYEYKQQYQLQHQYLKSENTDPVEIDTQPTTTMSDTILNQVNI